MYTLNCFPAKNGGEYVISLVESKGASENNVLVYTVVHFPAKNGGEYAISLDESKGASENNVLEYTLYCFPAKKRGRKTDKCQRGLETANIYKNNYKS